jgi:hypothetical protein
MGHESVHVCVKGFAGALRRYADLLEADPDRAYLDVGADLFDGVTGLAGEKRFRGELSRQRRRVGREIAPCRVGGWMQAFLGFCAAAASVASRGRREDGDGVVWFPVSDVPREYQKKESVKPPEVGRMAPLPR